MSSNCNHATCQGDTCRREKKAPKQRTPIKRTPIYRSAPKPKEKDDEMEQFWNNCYDIIARHPYCMNCHAWISPQFYRHAVAHLFPKKIFASIKSHPLNWLPLGAGCGCHEISHRLDKFSKTPVWRFAVERFRQFEPQITEHHKYLDTFREYAKQ